VKISDENKAVKLTLSGTQEGIKAVDKGRVLIIPSKDE